MERDSLGKATNNECFGEDPPKRCEGIDKYPGNVGNPSISLLKENFKPAYIRVVDDIGHLDPTDEDFFRRNVQQELARKQADDVQDVKTIDDFFPVVHIFAMYEQQKSLDFDPDGSKWVLGQYLVVGKKKPSVVIYTEVVRDMAGKHINRDDLQGRIVKKDTLMKRVVLHEVAHRLFDHTSGGPMKKENLFFGSRTANQFTDEQLHELRETPGYRR